MMASILRRDDLMLVVPYLQHTFTLNSPAMLVGRSGSDRLFDVHKEELDYIFQKAVEYQPKSGSPSAATT
jgi:hypothetical protein